MHKCEHAILHDDVNDDSVSFEKQEFKSIVCCYYAVIYRVMTWKA